VTWEDMTGDHALLLSKHQLVARPYSSDELLLLALLASSNLCMSVGRLLQAMSQLQFLTEDVCANSISFE